MKKYKTDLIAIVAVLFFTTVSQLCALNIETDIIAHSKKQIGSRYQTGGTQPPAFDCSGFISFVFKPFVPSLPRLSKDMADFATPIAKKALQPGDLVFFATTATPGAISHVALYIGNGDIIHAISDGPQQGVAITSLESRYWKQHYHSSARVLPLSKSTSPVKPPPPVASQDAKDPWNFWDGIIEGDYATWKEQDKKRFEEFKKKESGKK